MAECRTSDTEFWTMRGQCSKHGQYAYQVRNNEESVGCPVCSVKMLERKLERLEKTMNTSVMFSSKSDEWETPKWLFDALDEYFCFTIDVCATEQNAKCFPYFSPETDGLMQDWSGEIAWCNPPYSQVKRWVQKAYEEGQKGATVVALLPARTDTRWFHEYIYKKAEIHFIKGRLKFVGADNSAPFPSMIVVFRRDWREVIRCAGQISNACHIERPCHPTLARTCRS